MGFFMSHHEAHSIYDKPSKGKIYTVVIPNELALDSHSKSVTGKAWGKHNLGENRKCKETLAWWMTLPSEDPATEVPPPEFPSVPPDPEATKCQPGSQCTSPPGFTSNKWEQRRQPAHAEIDERRHISSLCTSCGNRLDPVVYSILA